MTRLRPKRSLAIALAAAFALQAANAAAQAAPSQESAVPADPAAASQANPFFAESPLPLHYPQFDRIHDSDFAPAFDRGMAEELAEVRAIADNPAPPTFQNTILALERKGQVLNRAQTVFSSLVGADTNAAREKLRAEYAPKFSAHRDAIVLDPKLFARIKALHDGLATSTLDDEGKRLVTKYY
jgi:peptidyl-dipeptidase Dcp